MKNLSIWEITQNINFEDPYIQSEVDWESLMSALHLSEFVFWCEQDKLKCYFIEKKLCTDTLVGKKAYFFNGEFVAISNKRHRKTSEEFKFVNQEVAKMIRDYVVSLIDSQNDYSFDVLEDNFTLPEFFQVEYSTEILNKKAYYLGSEVKIMKSNFRDKGTEHPDYWHGVQVRLDAGIWRTVDCRELFFNRFKLD